MKTNFMDINVFNGGQLTSGQVLSRAREKYLGSSWPRAKMSLYKVLSRDQEV